MILPLADISGPAIDAKALAPEMATTGGSLVVLMAGLFRPRVVQRTVVPLLAVVSLLAAIGLTVWAWEPGDRPTPVAGAVDVDTLALAASMIFFVAGLVTVLLSLRAEAPVQLERRECFG